MIYNNYHKHSHYTATFMVDSNVKPIDYAKRCVELECENIFTTEHAFGGDIFNYKEVADANGLHCKFGMEGYIVENPLEKDDRNYHIMLIPKTNEARKKLNRASSKANKEGFYYRPRLFLNDLLDNFDDDLYITTACVAGIARDDNSINNILIPLIEKHKQNVLLEVQSHNVDIQKEINKKILELKKKYGLRLIGATDSHYIYPEQAKERTELLKGKGITYGEEDEFILDYPSYDELYNRFILQGVLSEEQIKEALETTLLFNDCEDIYIDKSVKMPTIYKGFSEEEKIAILKEEINEGFGKVVIEDEIPKERRKEYIEEIVKEMKTIEDTEEVHSADYFLLNKRIIDKAINEYGGVLTKSGRGSCASFCINRMLGITYIDMMNMNLPIYSERFMSTARLLENKSMPDIDYNIVEQEPFVKATRDLLGEHQCYPMIAYGTMQLSEAFRNVCRSAGLEYSTYNKMTQHLDEYRGDKFWGKYIEEAEKYVGTIISASVHPCSHLVSNFDIEEELGVVKIGDFICVPMTSTEADDWKYLKEDFLIVTVVRIIERVFNSIGKETISIHQLLKETKNDDRVWKLFEDGITCTLNQVDSSIGTGYAMKYKPKNIEELAMLVAAIRPAFDAFRKDFLNRIPFKSGSEQLDKLMYQTSGFTLFQDNLLKFFEWLGVSPAISIGLIKKIAKKKIKPKDFRDLEETLRKNWIKQVGNDDKFDDIWSDMQGQMSYGFNCVSGDTIIQKVSTNQYTPLTVEEMYLTKNNIKYAKENGHKDLRQKYNSQGYGYGLSLYDDNNIRPNKIVDIYDMGIKDMYLVTTESGKQIKCTQDHRFPTPKGKKQLCQLKIGDELYTKSKRVKIEYDYRLYGENNLPQKGQQGFQTKNFTYEKYMKEKIENKESCEICKRKYDGKYRFELHHKDMDRTHNTEKNLQWLCCSCHKKEHYKNGRKKRWDNGHMTVLEKIVSIEYIGKEKCYDVEMEHPYHTFVVNDGIVTCNCGHGYATACDALYGAYLKVNYPIEYYTVVLDLYKDDADRTLRLVQELDYFGIKFDNKVKFRYSSNEYRFDKENNTIYKGIGSIKNIGKSCGDNLYELKDNHYEYFVDLLNAIYNSPQGKLANKTELIILICIDFFSEFGDLSKLLNIYKIYEQYYKRKTLKKAEISNSIFLEKHVKTHCAKETDKQYSGVDMLRLLELYERDNIWDKKTTELRHLVYEIAYIGFTERTVPTLGDDIRVVVGVEVNKYGTPFITLYKPSDGTTDTYKLNKWWYKEHTVVAGDTIRIAMKEKNKHIKDENNKWVETDEEEKFIENYYIAKRFEELTIDFP